MASLAAEVWQRLFWGVTAFSDQKHFWETTTASNKTTAVETELGYNDDIRFFVFSFRYSAVGYPDYVNYIAFVDDIESIFTLNSSYFSRFVFVSMHENTKPQLACTRCFLNLDNMTLLRSSRAPVSRVCLNHRPLREPIMLNCIKWLSHLHQR